MSAPYERFNQSDRVYFLQANPDTPDEPILKYGIVDSTARQAMREPIIVVALIDDPRMPSVSPPELFSERTVIKAILERQKTLRAINASRFYMDEIVEGPASRQELITMLADMRQERGLEELIGAPQQASAETTAAPLEPQRQGMWRRAVAWFFD